MNIYDKYGYKFLYPENWFLEENEMETDEGSITLNSPSGAFWTLLVRPFGFNPDQLAEDVLKTMFKEYQDIEYERISRTIAGFTLLGYEMNFYFLDLTNTAVVLTFADESRSFAIFHQAGDQMVICTEEQPFTNDQVFDAITTSLLRNL